MYRLLVDIDLEENKIREFLWQLNKNWADEAAGPTPCGSEVNHHLFQTHTTFQSQYYLHKYKTWKFDPVFYVLVKLGNIFLSIGGEMLDKIELKNL